MLARDPAADLEFVLGTSPRPHAAHLHERPILSRCQTPEDPKASA